MIGAAKIIITGGSEVQETMKLLKVRKGKKKSMRKSLPPISNPRRKSQSPKSSPSKKAEYPFKRFFEVVNNPFTIGYEKVINSDLSDVHFTPLREAIKEFRLSNETNVQNVPMRSNPHLYFASFRLKVLDQKRSLNRKLRKRKLYMTILISPKRKGYLNSLFPQLRESLPLYGERILLFLQLSTTLRILSQQKRSVLLFDVHPKNILYDKDTDENDETLYTFSLTDFGFTSKLSALGLEGEDEEEGEEDDDEEKEETTDRMWKKKVELMERRIRTFRLRLGGLSLLLVDDKGKRILGGVRRKIEDFTSKVTELTNWIDQETKSIKRGRSQAQKGGPVGRMEGPGLDQGDEWEKFYLQTKDKCKEIYFKLWSMIESHLKIEVKNLLHNPKKDELVVNEEQKTKDRLLFKKIFATPMKQTTGCDALSYLIDEVVSLRDDVEVLKKEVSSLNEKFEKVLEYIKGCERCKGIAEVV